MRMKLKKEKLRTMVDQLLKEEMIRQHDLLVEEENIGAKVAALGRQAAKKGGNLGSAYHAAKEASSGEPEATENLAMAIKDIDIKSQAKEVMASVQKASQEIGRLYMELGEIFGKSGASAIPEIESRLGELWQANDATEEALRGIVDAVQKTTAGVEKAIKNVKSLDDKKKEDAQGLSNNVTPGTEEDIKAIQKKISQLDKEKQSAEKDGSSITQQATRTAKDIFGA